MRTTMLVTLLLAGALPALAQRPERLFYYVDRADSYESLKRNIGSIDALAPSAFFVDAQGMVWGEIDRRVLELAAAHKVAVHPLLVNRGFDQAALHTFLINDEARARTVAAVVELARRNGAAGIQVDFENVSIDDRDALTRFYRELANALHAAGKMISIAVVHRPDELAGASLYDKWMMSSWRGGYDMKALADAGDFISLMSYSQHTRRTPPGPNGGIPWMNQVTDYALQHVPANKLSMGIAVGAMRWYVSQEDRITPELARSYAETLSYSWAMGIIERRRAKMHWDDEQKASFAYYPNGGTWEWIFVEDARTFAAKYEIVKAKKLRGFSVWVLGPEDPAIWDVLK
jgi:spore germination protein YaaH